MVKITNPLGDVKIGRQGEVVYQRKYGEQIRRTAQPKRAMSSETQLKHRQLYRDALDWRKQLSLANRRYLEGYCIANGVIDSYGVPLAWSRFALKLYLEKVRFVVIDKSVDTREDNSGKLEYYDNVGDFDSYNPLYDPYWRGQTFTPSWELELAKVGVYVKRIGIPGDLWVRIRATDGTGRPTGGDLAADKWAYSQVPLDWTWMEKALTTTEPLGRNVKYALTLNATGDATKGYHHATDITEPYYPGGIAVWSNDNGVTWYNQGDRDNGFRVYGNWTEGQLTPGLIHVRHPALLTAVHKRGDLIIKAYDTLSSLDEQYLTKQVGFDVEAGDTIEATTLPGIEYKCGVG